MTETTDIAALREECAQWVKKTFGDTIDTRMALNDDGNNYMAYDMAVIWKAWHHLSGKLEVERHRADQRLKESAARNRKLRARMRSAEAEIAVLKAKLANPNVLPVGEIVAWAGTDIEKGITREVDFRFLRFDVQPGQQLFTAQQKPVVHPDTKRMDWLCSHVVEVREPLFYGSHSMFWSQCDSDDCEEHHTTLREQVDAAIEAAGRIVKDGKLLALRQGDNMKEKCLTCGREMSDEPDSLNLNCGGDCLECMASHGDPDCISAVTRIKARKRDAGSNGTEA